MKLIKSNRLKVALTLLIATHTGSTVAATNIESELLKNFGMNVQYLTLCSKNEHYKSTLLTQSIAGIRAAQLNNIKFTDNLNDTIQSFSKFQAESFNFGRGIVLGYFQRNKIDDQAVDPCLEISIMNSGSLQRLKQQVLELSQKK